MADVDLEIRPGEMLGLVGESGSGKTLTALALMDLLPAGLHLTAGALRLEGHDELAMPGHGRRVRGRLGMIFQEPRAALNPLYSIGFQLSECLRTQGIRGRDLRRRGVALLEQVALPDAESRWGAFPHQLSGGQCQRVMLAMALAGEPVVLIADEPTTALDVSVQAQVLDLIRRLQRDLGLAVLLITHDLALVATVCDRVMVMEKGEVVERAPVGEIFAAPRAAATRRLLQTVGTEGGGSAGAEGAL